MASSVLALVPLPSPTANRMRIIVLVVQRVDALPHYPLRQAQGLRRSPLVRQNLVRGGLSGARQKIAVVLLNQSRPSLPERSSLALSLQGR